MQDYQAGIFTEGSQYHRYYEWVFPALNMASQSDITGALNQIREFVVKLVELQSLAGVDVVVAFSECCLQHLDASALSLRDFGGFKSADGSLVAPATQRHLLVWLHSNDLAALTDTQLAMQQYLSGVDHELFYREGFVYRDSRDLTGFVDGSANPKADARINVAIVPEGQPGAGGSFVLTQQWRHNLPAFAELLESEQERVIGRTKAQSIELEGDAMPRDSHVSRTDLKRDGIAQKIYRRSAPYIQGDEAGLYFLAFSQSLLRFDYLLQSMFGLDDVESPVTDHLMQYSTATSGSYWFAPAQSHLFRLSGSAS